MFALAHGAGKSLFCYGDRIKKPGVAIVSCNDGLRSVIMKLEAFSTFLSQSTIRRWGSRLCGRPYAIVQTRTTAVVAGNAMPSWTNCRTGQEGLANLQWLRRSPDSSKAELVHYHPIDVTA